MFRKFVGLLMLAVFPASLMAADSGAAMMYAYGSASVNGSSVPRSSAIFPGDTVRTNSNSVAKINAPGLNVAVLQDSSVKFEGSSLSLDRGTVSVATSNGTAARIGEMTVTPASKAQTQYQVTEGNGKLQIIATKGDISLTDLAGTTTLSEGKRTTRYASSGQKGGAAPAAGGGILDSPIAIGIGVAAVAGLVTWVLVQGSEPASPSKP